MRRALFIVILLAVIGGLFAVYVAIQPETPRTVKQDTTGPRDPMYLSTDRRDSVGDVGPGSEPWMRVYDDQRRLSYKFQAARYAPERAGRVAVEGPRAEFFQYVRDEDDPTGNTIRTQRIQLVGKTGEVEVQQGPRASADKGFEKGSGGPPKRGLLNDVTIKLYHHLSDEEKGIEPVMTITAPNVAFDNESFEIATRGYRNEKDVDVPADQVPIVINGDYEFRGRGLNMRWNDVDGRLEHLEIAHGDYLIIRNPEGLSKRDDEKKAASTAAPQASPWIDADGRTVVLAQAGGAPAGLPKTRPAARNASPSQPPYRATFERDVRVSEGQLNVAETPLASADLIYLDFRSGSSRGPATKPATRPVAATQPVAATLPAVAEATPAAPDRLPEKPKTLPATKPVQPPIIVRWSGKLRIMPLESQADLPIPLANGQSVLRFIGKTSPVRLTKDFNQIDCTAADYYSGDRSVMVRGSTSHGPVVLRQLPDPKLPPEQSRQATIVTQSLNYDGGKQIATLHGRSNAIITMPQERSAKSATQPDRPQTMTAAWSQLGQLFFRNGAGGEMSFDRAEFSGDVDVNHPQLALKSQALSLAFEEAKKTAATTRPATQLQLRQVVATTDVWADLLDAQGQKQTVTTDRLTVDTSTDAEGRMYPRIVTAVGNTHAFDEKQSLRAGGVELTLAPVVSESGLAKNRVAEATSAAQGAATKPAETDTVPVELQSVRAWDGVLVSGADGATAAGETMNVKAADGQIVATIAGQVGFPSARPAVVTDARGNTVTGPVIEFDPKRQWAKVAGAGSIRAFQAEEKPKADSQTKPAVAATHPARPRKFVDVVWQTEAEMDGLKDRIVVAGPVVVSSTDDDGTFSTARGKRAVIELSPRPVGPATRPVASASTKPSRPTTRPGVVPGLAGDGGMDFLKDKMVSAVNLEEDAIANSTLSDETGILRQFELKSDRFRYEADAPATRPTEGPLAMSEGGRLIVPGPGTMIYRDHRPTRPSTRPSTQPTGDAVVASNRAAPSPEPGVTSDAPGQARGATAFQWTRSLVYDQRTREANMLGDVVIVHQPDGAGELPVRVTGDRALAIFEAKAISRARTQPAKPEASKPDPIAMQLKRLMIAGNLTVLRAGSEMTADRMVYDPTTGWMTAHGADRQPATYTDTAGQPSVWADEIHWNAQSWLTKFVGIRVRSGSDPKGLGQK